MQKTILIFAIFCGYEALAHTIKVSVYYETLCPDSINFLVKQFYPTHQELYANMEVDLVAYGKATASNESGTWVFECQHGPAECYGNKVHSCAIELYPVNQSTDFVVCAMNSTNASSDANLELCATSNNVSWTTLQNCLSSGQADELLAANGRRTDKLIPVLINFVPTIVLNDIFSQELQSLSLSHFRNTLVFILDQIECGFCHFSGSNTVLGSGTFVFSFSLVCWIVQKLSV